MKTSVSRIMAMTAGATGLIVLAFGCKSVEEHVEEQRAEIHRYYPELTVDPHDLPERLLDWDTAVSMLSSNLVMRKANEEIIKAEVAVNRVFLDLIPELTLQGIYTQAIKDVTELSSENFNVNVNAMFLVPGIVRLRMDYYAAMLACFKAQQQYELACREEVVNLYSLFRQYQRLEQSRRIETLNTASPYLGTAERTELEFMQRQKETELWLGLSSALGCYSNNWRVTTDHLPAFDYLATPLDWDDPEKVGKLYVTLQATELEGARLREMGIKFQYWPQLNMRVYSPSVYLLSGGDRGGFEFDAEDIRFEASVRMRLDSNLRIRDQLREAQRGTDLLKQALYEDSQERLKKLADAHEALAIIDTRMRQVVARRQLLQSIKQTGNYEMFERHKAACIELMNQQLALEQERDGIIPVLWIADELWWSPEQTDS